jgi:alpha-beta hydrolase superfamily lysophospholipase
MDDSVVDPTSKAATAALERSNRPKVIVGHSTGHCVCRPAAIQLMQLVMVQLDLFRYGVDGPAGHCTI